LLWGGGLYARRHEIQFGKRMNSKTPKATVVGATARRSHHHVMNRRSSLAWHGNCLSFRGHAPGFEARRYGVISE